MRRVLRNNGLSIVMFGFFALFLFGQSVSGHRVERERLIELHATRIAFRVLLAAAVLTVGSAHLGVRMTDMMGLMMLSVILALLVKFGSEVVFFRRGL